MGKQIPTHKLKAFANQGGDEQEEKPKTKGGGKPMEDLGKHKSAEDVLEDCVSRLENGDLDEQVDDALADFDPDEHDYPRMVKDHDLWDEAEEAVDPEQDGEQKYDDPWLLTGLVYKAMGGTFSDDDGDEHGGEAEGDHEEPDGDEDDY